MKGVGWIHSLILICVNPVLLLDHSYRHNKHDVHFAGFFPTSLGYMETSIGQGVMPAVKLAIRHVNKSPVVLPHNRIRMHWNNTACNPGVGLKSLFDMVHQEPRKVILFGDACSNVTDQIVKAARHWNLVQVTYADTHPMFTARSFPHFFRVVPSENQFNNPRLALLRQFNWTRVGTLYQNEARYSLAHNDLIMELESNDFDVVVSQSFNDELTTQLDAMMENDVRIILGNFNQTWASVVFCDAYRKKVYGEKFQWLIVGMYESDWWRREDPSLECTSDQILEALNGTLVVEIQTISSNGNATTISGKTPIEYEREYESESLKAAREYTRRNKRSESPPNIYSRFHGYAYDGIWAIALAIQAVNEEAKLNNQTMLDFKYRDVEWEQRFIKALSLTSFQGVTGRVQFKENSRRGTILINQIIGDEEKCVGEYSGVTRTLHMERCNQISWNKVPKDRTVTRIELTRVNLTIYSILVVVASLGIVTGLGFLAVNIKYRHQKQIKMSSPNLNNLIIIGSILCYTSVIILGLDSTLTSQAAFPYICAGRAWILMSGFTLSFGSMFSKTWRVHSIFTNVQLNKKVMKDSQLFLVVGILLTMDIIIMTTWQVFDPFFRKTEDLRPYSPHGDVDVLIIPLNEYCKSNYMHIFVGIIYAYKGLLMVFGAFLAWETRNVQIPALNDSKYVGMSVYNVVIMCVLGVAVSYVLNEDQNASFIIISVFIIFCTTGTLCLVFVPKIIELRRDPLGVSAKEKPHIRSGGNKVKVNSTLQSLDDKLRIANKVKSKYQGLRLEKDEILESMYRQVGDQAQAILQNGGTKRALDIPKGDVSLVRIEEGEHSSCLSEPSSSKESADSDATRKLGPNSPLLGKTRPDGPGSIKEKSSSNGKVLSDRKLSVGHSTNCDMNQTYQDNVEKEKPLKSINQSREKISSPNNDTQPESVQMLPIQLSGRVNPANPGLLGDRTNQEYSVKCRSQEFYLSDNLESGCQSNQVFQVAAGTWSGDKSNLSRRQSCPCHVKPMVLHSPLGWHTPPNQDIWDSPGLPPEDGWISPPPAPPSGWNSPSSCSCSSADQELPISCFDNESRLHCSHSSPLNLECSHRASRGLDCSHSHLSESCCRHGSEHYTEDGFGDAVDEENTYYRVGCVSDQGESTLEDQATQTDDEAEDDPPIKLRRPTNFKNGGVLWSQVRSQEELSSGVQNFKINQQELEMKGSIKRPKAKTKNSAVTAAPIFQRLLDGEDTRQLSKLVSCPNIAVKCDIVEYL